LIGDALLNVVWFYDRFGNDRFRDRVNIAFISTIEWVYLIND
jgi:hypothetical protein